jgi:hypothetical protein
VVAARSEIERITADLALVQRRLLDELHPLAQLNGLVHHIQLDLKLPETMVRIGLQRHGCYVAAENYFTVDAQVAHRLNSIAQIVHENKWISNAIPKEAWVAIGAATVAAGFSNSNVTAQVVRAGASQMSINQMNQATRFLPPDRVWVNAEPVSEASPPKTMGALAQRLNNHSGHIRIEGYETARGRVLFMYLPGTSNWLPVGNGKAFDLKSNLELLGGEENTNSSRAAHAALCAYGAKPEDRLVLIGYSQGGILAASIAEHNPNVVGLVTIGSPVANAQLPEDLPTLSIEHSNDVVPALAGETNPLTKNWATASRHVNIELGENVLEAHDISSYAETAMLVDQSTSSGLVRIREEILGNLAGAKPLGVREFQPLKAVALP